MTLFSQRESFYQKILEEQALFICRFDLDGKILFVNQSFCQHLETSLEDLTKQNFFQLIATEDISPTKNHILSLTSANLLVDLEFLGKRKQGFCRQKWDFHAVVQEQKIIGYQAVGKEFALNADSSQKGKTNFISTSHKCEKEFKAAVNNASVLIWISDINDYLTFVNQFWLEFTDKNLEAVLGGDRLINLHPEDRRIGQILYQNAFRNRQYFNLECRLLNSRDEYRYFFVTGVPRFAQADEFLGFVWSGVDISKQKKVENLLKRQAKRNYILAKSTRHIHESLDLATILQTATEQVNFFLKAERIIIGKFDSTDSFKILSKSTISSERNSCKLSPFLNLKLWQLDLNFDSLSAGEIIFFDRFHEDSPLVNKNQSAKPRSEMNKTLTISCSTIVVPIRLEQKLWGVICAEPFARGRQWKLEEVSLLEQITTQLAIAIKQAELYQALEEANQQL